MQRITAIAVILILAAGSPALAVTWNEVGDAGELPATGQITTGDGALTAITGSLGVNDVDMFRIYITGGGTFSAEVTSALDTQLFLFDASGLGIYADDDTADQDPLLPAGIPQTPTTPGFYWLAISQFNSDPISDFGLIFLSPQEAENGADGPGAAFPVTDFLPDGEATGTYTIALTGARTMAGGNGPLPPGVIPEPLTMAGLLLGLGAVGRYIRRR